jgi:hypothetical protein
MEAKNSQWARVGMVLGGACVTVLVGLVARGGDGIVSRLLLFSVPLRWGREVFGTMTGVLNISSDTVARTGVSKH